MSTYPQNQNRRNPLPLIITAIVVVVAIIVAAVLILPRFLEPNLLETGVSTNAKPTGGYITRVNPDYPDETQYAKEYEYEVNGSTYLVYGRFESGDAERIATVVEMINTPGNPYGFDPIKVYYDPENPSDSVIDTSTEYH